MLGAYVGLTRFGSYTDAAYSLLPPYVDCYGLTLASQQMRCTLRLVGYFETYVGGRAVSSLTQGRVSRVVLR